MLLGALFAACDPSGGGGSSNPTPEPPTPKPKAWHVSTFAGGGSSTGTDGIGTAAGFSSPFRIAQIGDTLYVTDENRHSLRTIDTSTARVGTIVTNRFIGGYNDGAGTSARFDNPRGAAAGAGNTLYIADFDNHRIRKVTIDPANLTAAATQVSTIAGGSTAGHVNDATGTNARFNKPMGLAVSEDETTLYVADSGNHRIRAINLASTAVTTIAGSGTQGHADGAGTAAQFSIPSGLAVSGSILYVADNLNHRIRAIDLTSKAVTTIAGDGTAGYANGMAATARFRNPLDIAVSEDKKTLYIADANNHRIRAIDIASGTVRDIAGDGTRGNTNGIGTAARLANPTGIAVSAGTLYVTSGNLIRKLEYREVDP